MSQKKAETGRPALEIRNVTKFYDDLKAVDNASLTVHQEVFGLLGANGAGKSTLLKAILGLLKVNEGEILICGVHTRHHSVEAKKLVGYLPEDLRLYDRLTGWEFLTFVAGIKGCSATERIEEDLRYFGLYHERHLLIEEYSLGMKKKIGVIAALTGSPRVLLLDEPLNGLDAESMRLLRQRLEALHEKGTTIIISSHIMGFVERTCHRVAVLKKGRIVAEGSPFNLRAQASMPDAPFEDVFLHFAL